MKRSTDSPPHRFDQTIVIDAPADVVWDTLTGVERMKAWMGEPEMRLDIATDWRIGGPIVVRGVHHKPFENRGTVLRFQAQRRLSYTHLSSLSRLPDTPESCTTLDFRLSPSGDMTSLRIVITGFPTLTIFEHMQFYWHGTLNILKQHAERHWASAKEHDHEIQR